MKEKKFRVKGIKNGSYFVAEVVSSHEHKRGDGLIIPAGTPYYLHLQYPTLHDGLQQLSYLLHCGEKICAITTSQKINPDAPFMLSPYLGNANYTSVWHYKIFNKLGVIR